MGSRVNRWNDCDDGSFLGKYLLRSTQLIQATPIPGRRTSYASPRSVYHSKVSTLGMRGESLMARDRP
jgi:hypothetical protein